MVLFSTLARYSKEQQQQTSTASSSSSSSIPTIVQLYTTASPNPLGHNAVTEDSKTSTTVSKHAVLTYQAIEVGLHSYYGDGADDDDEEDSLFGVVKKPQNNPLLLSAAASVNNNNQIRPNLGMWHCRVDATTTTASSTSNNNTTTSATAITASTGSAASGSSLDASSSRSLVDHLLSTMIPSAHTMTTKDLVDNVNWPICWTVDLSNPTLVEPCISRLSQTLIRYLVSSNASTESDDQNHRNGKALAPTTTSLKQLQATTFGLAPDDIPKSNSSNNSQTVATDEEEEQPQEDRRICLMIAAILPRQTTSSSSSSSEQDSPVKATSSSWAGSAYEEQQAQALVLYHLRRYAAAVNAILVFVQTDAKPKATQPPQQDHQLPAITKQQLWQLWLDLAQGKEVWKTEDTVIASGDEEDPTSATSEDGSTPPEVAAAAPAIYGPGQHYEDLIESVLLRNANCPGHWDAAKDSLWVALPSQEDNDGSNAAGSTAPTATGSNTPKFGDDDWLAQLRDSAIGVDPKANVAVVASGSTSATGAAATNPLSQGGAAGADGVKASDKDTGVASYFESLLKKP